MTTCPTCGRGPRIASPVEQVVAGDVGPDVAPLLCKVWAMVAALTKGMDGREVRQQDLVPHVMDLTGAAERTVVNTIAAAVRAGHLHREYRMDGDPPRRRSYLTWMENPA